MAKIKFTKNELKKQKDELKKYYHYLPTLQLKKQQLQIELVKILHLLEETEAKKQQFLDKLNNWIDVFAEEISLRNLVKIKEIKITATNIAGVDSPSLEGVEFLQQDYDFFKYPLWADYGIDALKQMLMFNISTQVLQRQLEAIRQELAITTQRVNLFEKVKIPQAEENIRKIRITLGDLQTASVVRGKMAKAKIEKQEGALVV